MAGWRDARRNRSGRAGAVTARRGVAVARGRGAAELWSLAGGRAAAAASVPAPASAHPCSCSPALAQVISPG